MSFALTYCGESTKGKKEVMSGQVWHVVPSDEPHELDAHKCPCETEVNELPHGGIIVIHKRFDWH